MCRHHRGTGLARDRAVAIPTDLADIGRHVHLAVVWVDTQGGDSGVHPDRLDPYRTGAGGAATSRCSIPAGRKSRSEALSSCGAVAQRRRLSASRRRSASDSSDSSTSGSRSEPVGAVVSGVGSDGRSSPASVGSSSALDRWRRLQAQTTQADQQPQRGLPPSRRGRPASQINGAPTNTPAQTAATNPRAIRDIPSNVRSQTPIGLVAALGQRRRAKATEPATPTAATAISRPSHNGNAPAAPPSPVGTPDGDPCRPEMVWTATVNGPSTVPMA